MNKSDKENKDISSHLKVIAKTSLIVFVGLLVSKILTYLYRIIIARYFGPEIYGLFSLALTIVSLFIIIAFVVFMIAKFFFKQEKVSKI